MNVIGLLLFPCSRALRTRAPQYKFDSFFQFMTLLLFGLVYIHYIETFCVYQIGSSLVYSRDWYLFWEKVGVRPGFYSDRQVLHEVPQRSFSRSEIALPSVETILLNLIDWLNWTSGGGLEHKGKSLAKLTDREFTQLRHHQIDFTLKCITCIILLQKIVKMERIRIYLSPHDPSINGFAISGIDLKIAM